MTGGAGRPMRIIQECDQDRGVNKEQEEVQDQELHQEGHRLQEGVQEGGVQSNEKWEGPMER